MRWRGGDVRATTGWCGGGKTIRRNNVIRSGGAKTIDGVTTIARKVWRRGAASLTEIVIGAMATISNMIAIAAAAVAVEIIIPI